MRGRWWRRAAVALFLVAVAVPTTIYIVKLGDAQAPTLDTVDRLASVLSFGFAVVSVVVGLRNGYGRRPETSPENGRQILEDLHWAVRLQLQRDVVQLRLRHPDPMRLTWSSTLRPAASAQAVLDDTHDLRQFPLRGRIGSDMRRFLEELPRRQLMILGKPGAGKTVLATLFALSLTDDPVGVVPVLLPARAWNPDESVGDFVARRLVEDYPHLSARHRDPRALAQRLVEQQRILPVLDGLDETADTARAMTALSQFGAAGHPFIATCRAEEYEEAVARTHVLPLVAVVELEPPTSETVAQFLTSAVPVSDRRWTPLIETIREDFDGPLAQTLSTPLYVQLLRSIYERSDSAPSEVLDTTRFPSRAAIERHLLDHFLAEAIGGSPAQRRKAERWLSFLAMRLERTRAAEITVSDLADAAPPPVFLAAAAVLAFAAGSGAAMAAPWLGVVVAAAVAVAGGVSSLTRPSPRAVGAGWRYLGGRRLLNAVVLGIALSTVSVGLAWTSAQPADRSGLVAIGLSFLPMTTLRDWVGVPTTSRLVPNTRAVIAGDQLYGILCALLCGGVGVAVALVAQGWTAAAGTAAAGVLIGFSGTLSYRLFLSRLWLAARGRAPFRLLGFLQSAHNHGVLRQRGPAYQFRNAALQKYLAALDEPAKIVGDQRDTPASLAIVELRSVLVELAFRQVAAQTLIEPDRVDRLKAEIGAELRNESDRIAAATSAQWERLETAKGRYFEQVGVPRVAYVAPVYLWLAGAAVAFTAAEGTLWLWSRSRSPMLIGAALLPICAALLITLPGLERWRLRAKARTDAMSRMAETMESLATGNAPGQDTIAAGMRARWRRRLLETSVFPEPWWPKSRTASQIVMIIGAAGFIVSSFLPFSSLAIAIATTGAAATLLVGLWAYARAWHRRLGELRSEDKATWPSADDTPWATATRRTAVRAWEEWTVAVCDVGVLPLVSAKVEALNQRGYDTVLPAASVERLGDITEGVQFVNTAESDRLTRILSSTLTAAIGVSGPRGVGKTTLLRRFGDQRIGSSADHLMLVASAPTSYNSRDFLVHLFARLCLAVLPADAALMPPDRTRRRIRAWWPWTSAILGATLVAGSLWWAVATAVPSWLRENVRTVTMAVGAALILIPLVRAAALLIGRRRRPRDTSVIDAAGEQLRRLRYLETMTLTRGGTVKTPAMVDVTSTLARQRAEQLRTYPQLVNDFREFLGMVGLHLRSQPGRSWSRVIICIDELDKIASSEQAEQFLNDIKTIFGVDGSVFLIAVSEDALSSFSRRALSTRTTFDTAFDDIITLRRFSLEDTRRLLVQRVLRLPEPYVWLCHCLSGGLPRDLNRVVRMLFDVGAHRGMREFAALATELIRLDVETVAYGQALKLTEKANEAAARVVRWLMGTRRLPLTSAAVRGYLGAAPDVTDETVPDVTLSALQFGAYLEYVAVLLEHFCERIPETIERLRGLDDDTVNPIQMLAEARAALAIDPVLALHHIDDFQQAMSAPGPSPGLT